GGAALAQFLSDPNAKLNITGYSLGGHLANAFAALHPNNVLGMYLYNSAGLGTTSDGSNLASVMADYQRILLDPASQPAAQGDAAGAALRSQAIAYAAAHPNQFDAI